MQITGTDVRDDLSYNIGFIGGSRAGTAFAHYLTNSGINVSGFYSYNFDSAIASAHITQTKAYDNLSTLVGDSDIIFISVKDTYIHNIWLQIQQFNLHHKIICHLSGFLSSSIFDNSDEYCQGVASLHIPIAFTNKEIVPQEIKNAPFVIEGNAFAIDAIIQIAQQTNNSTLKIKTLAKPAYHAACVLASSLILAQLKIASNIIEESLFEHSQIMEAEKLVSNLALSALGNSKTYNSLIAAVTGPIIRNDTVMIAKHIEALQELSEIQHIKKQNAMNNLDDNSASNDITVVLYKILTEVLLKNMNIKR